MLHNGSKKRSYHCFPSSFKYWNCTRHWGRCWHIYYFTSLLVSLFSPKFQWEIKWYCKPFVGEIAAKCLEEIQRFNSRLKRTYLKCFFIPVQLVVFLPHSLNLPQKSQVWDLSLWALEQWRHIWNLQTLQRHQDWPTLVKKSICYIAKKFASQDLKFTNCL